MHPSCDHPTCDRPRHTSVGRYCNAHEIRSKRGGDMDKPIAPRRFRHAATCSWSGCDRPHYSAGLCSTHYNRRYKGRPMDGPPRKNPRIPGVTTRTTAAGYVHVWLPDHPDAFGGGWIFEHRWVMERELGRRLRPFESVHHRNGRRADNRPENLELWAKVQPSGQRVADLVEHARRILDLYG